MEVYAGYGEGNENHVDGGWTVLSDSLHNNAPYPKWSVGSDLRSHGRSRFVLLREVAYTAHIQSTIMSLHTGCMQSTVSYGVVIYS